MFMDLWKFECLRKMTTFNSKDEIMMESAILLVSWEDLALEQRLRTTMGGRQRSRLPMVQPSSAPESERQGASPIFLKSFKSKWEIFNINLTHKFKNYMIISLSLTKWFERTPMKPCSVRRVLRAALAERATLPEELHLRYLFSNYIQLTLMMQFRLWLWVERRFLLCFKSSSFALGTVFRLCQAVGCLECHGTGTALGDPIEAARDEMRC